LTQRNREQINLLLLRGNHNTDCYFLNRITFSAVGNSSILLNCSSSETGVETCTSAKPLLVKATLLFPVRITPAYVSGPQGHDTEGCFANSQEPSWAVTSAQLNLQKELGTIRGGTGFITIQNRVLGYSATCGGVLQGSGRQVLFCSPQMTVQRQPKYQIQTSIELDPVTFSVTVNQTWFCDDTDPAEP
jgi:hypothetical protein